MNRSSAEPPFYLWNPNKTKFVSTPQYPKTLGAQVNEIREDLLDELDDEDIPQKKKHGTLEYFLGGDHDMEEMIRDMQLANQALNHSSEDKCTLRHTMEDMKTSRYSKRLHHFDSTQMVGFKLQAQPEGLPVFPSSDFAQAEKKISREDHKRQKKLEKRRRRKAMKEAKEIVLNTATEDESSLSQYPFSSQETFTSLDSEIFQPRKTFAGPSLETAIDLSGMVFQQQKQSSRLFSKVASKKSVDHALKGLRGLTGASSRGRGHDSRTAKISMVHKPTAMKPIGRGRGRPRKISVGGNFTQNRSGNQPVALKLKQIYVPSLSESPSPPSPVPVRKTPSPQVVPQKNLEPVSISKFCGLKMTMKLNRPMSQSPGPASSQSTPENIRNRPRLVNIYF